RQPDRLPASLPTTTPPCPPLLPTTPAPPCPPTPAPTPAPLPLPCPCPFPLPVVSNWRKCVVTSGGRNPPRPSADKTKMQGW
ncbi:hypothetical protein Pcinc_027920, partial [Petrolisthes cinctipes]